MSETHKFDAQAFSELLKTAIGVNRSITKFSQECNVARPYISNFLNCKLTNPPSPQVIKKFSDYAANNIREVDLLAAAGYQVDSEDAFNIIFDYIVEDQDVSTSRTKLNLQYDRNKKIHPIPFEVPIVSLIDPDTIICSENIMGYDYIALSANQDASKCFYYVCSDQSMINARIHAGNMALIVPDKPHLHNDIVLILKDGESFLRRYKKLNSIHLFQAENNEFDSFVITNAELKKSPVTIIGTVDHVKFKTTT